MYKQQDGAIESQIHLIFFVVVVVVEFLLSKLFCAEKQKVLFLFELGLQAFLIEI